MKLALPEETIFHTPPVPKKFLRFGSLKNKIAVAVNSRTTLFINKRASAQKIKAAYIRHMENAYRPYCLKGANHKAVNNETRDRKKEGFSMLEE